MFENSIPTSPLGLRYKGRTVNSVEGNNHSKSHTKHTKNMCLKCRGFEC